MEVDIAGYSGNCDCGGEHNLLTQTVIIGKGATKKLSGVVKSLGLNSGGCVICDTNTEWGANLAAMETMRLLSVDTPAVSLEAKGLHADDRSTTALDEVLPQDIRWLIAAGSGTIHDITRFIAHKRGIPFISYPTAASMDGFASSICAMTIKGYKKTVQGVPPAAVVADTDVFAKAPYRLTASGISDILGKYTALADWKLECLLTEEKFCDKIYSMTKSALDDVRKNLPAIHAGEGEAMEKLMHSLIISGLAIQLLGNSRPASGSEHHLSHFWEMGIINDKTDALHGEMVGVGLLTALRQYEKLRAIKDVESVLEPYGGLPMSSMRKYFGDLYDDIMLENQPDPLRSITPEKIIAAFPEMKRILDELPEARKLGPFMKATGCLTTLEEIGLERNVIPESISMSPYVRRRLTFMRLLKMFKV